MVKRQFDVKFIHPDAEMAVHPYIKDVELESVESTHIDLKMHVVYPEATSSVFGQPCMVEVKVNENVLFDPVTQSTIDLQVLLQLESPRMVEKDLADLVATSTDIAYSTSAYTSSIEILISLMLGISLKSIWTILNTLQLVVYAADKI